MSRKKVLTAILSICLIVIVCDLACDSKQAQNAGAVNVKKERNTIEIDNGLIKAKFTSEAGSIKQEYLALKKGQWIVVAESFKPASPFPNNGNAIYNSNIDKENRLITTEIVDSIKITEQSEQLVRVTLSGNSGSSSVIQTVELAQSDDYFQIKVDATLGNTPPQLEYLLSPFVFKIEGQPDYTHIPGLKRNPRHKPEEDPSNLIGDRVFFSPAAILQKDDLFAAIVPDVDIINQSAVYAKGARTQKHPRVFPVPVDPDKITMPMALDLELESGLIDAPLVSYGMIDAQVQQHVYFYHDNTKGAMVRTLSSNKVRYGMDLFVKADALPGRGYQRVARHLWKSYGTKYFQKPKPQAMPYTEYAKICYPAAFSYKGSKVVIKNGLPKTVKHLDGPPEQETWQEWQIDDLPVGGLRLSAPQWFDMVYFSSWWNNIYDAIGMYLWGQKLNDQSLQDKARRIVNLILSAPQKDGMFPTYYHLKKKSWIRNLWKFPLEGFDPAESRNYWAWDDPDNSYQTASASVTAGFLMRYRLVCEDNPQILGFVEKYADFIIKNMQPDGSVPAWFDKELRALPSLKWNADGGSHIWVLSELYKATHEEKYLDAAKKMAKFMTDQVMPTQKWYDFEAFHSCAQKPQTFFDEKTGQPARNMMSAGWAIQGFTSLFEASNDRSYLDAAEAVADYASFYQTVWAPHYIITAYPFGGMSSQVGDAEWLDQRQHRFAEPFVHLGLLLNRQDLVERGIAAARSTLALINHPRLIKNKIYEYPNYPYGMGPENIDHEGNSQTPLRSGPSWSEVGGLAAVADVTRLIGDVFINVDKKLAAGVNGVRIIDYKLEGKTFRLELENQIATLPVPYDEPYEIKLKIDGLPDAGSYNLIINDGVPQQVTAAELSNYSLEIVPK